MCSEVGLNRFHNGAEKYAHYLETPEGRLRLDLAFAHLQEFLPRDRRSARALDLGCGNGVVGIRLAQLGFQVTMLDTSLPMLELSKQAAQEARVTEKVQLQHRDATQLESLFNGEVFDVVLCHNVLEYTDDPVAVLRGAARLLRTRASLISILVRNQAGETLKTAIREGDLAGTDQSLTAEWGHESLYGGKVRLFSATSLHSMLVAVSLAPAAEHGVRVVSDYLPAKISRQDEYQRIFELELKLGKRPEFAAVARYMQCLAHRASPTTKDDA